MEDKQDNPTIAMNTSKPNNAKRVVKRVWMVISMVATVVAIGFIVLLAMGIVRVTFQSNQQARTVAAEIVCDRGDVLRYNETLSASPMNQDEIVALDKKVVEFGKTIETKNRYETDPTCVYMVYSGAFRADDMEKATKSLDTLQSLSDKNLFIDSRVSGIQSIDAMRKAIEAKEGVPEGSDFFNTGG